MTLSVIIFIYLDLRNQKLEKTEKNLPPKDAIVQRVMFLFRKKHTVLLFLFATYHN